MPKNPKSQAPVADPMSPRRLLRLFLIASSLSLVFGIFVSGIVFQVWGLERNQPFSRLYMDSDLGIWKSVSQYMLCTSIQWLMEVQSRTVEEIVRSLSESRRSKELAEAEKLEKQAAQLEGEGQATLAVTLRARADRARRRARELERQAERITGPWQEVVLQGQTTVDKRYYISRYYSLIVIPLLALWTSIWIVAAYLPREVRQTNEIVKIGAVVGLFHGGLLGGLVIMWSVFGGESLREFYGNGHFYHGQWTGLWLFPVLGVILTGYLFGTLAGWLAKGVEKVRLVLWQGGGVKFSQPV